MDRIRICFVCLGNICRSPTAEAVFLDLIEREGLADRFDVDSAGTGGWHVGERAHPDTRAAAKERGIEIRSVARQFRAEDFARFDYVVAMDRSNFTNLSRMARSGDADKLHLFRDFDPQSAKGSEVPDPYYRGRLRRRLTTSATAAAKGFLSELRASHDL